MLEYIYIYIYIYIYVEAFINPNSLTLDYNITVFPLNGSTKYQDSKTIVPQNHVQTHAQNMGGFTYEWDRIPNFFFAGALPRTPTGGAAAPPVTPLLRLAQHTARGASRGKNITHTQQEAH